VTRVWIAPLGGQLILLAQWLEPIVSRPGLVPVPAGALHIVVGAAQAAEPPVFEPFDALVGPVRVDEQEIVADVIPVEPFLELRQRLGLDDTYAPRVVFARGDGSAALEQIEAIASDAVSISTLTLAEQDA
jgi:hypothetical protein